VPWIKTYASPRHYPLPPPSVEALLCIVLSVWQICRGCPPAGEISASRVRKYAEAYLDKALRLNVRKTDTLQDKAASWPAVVLILRYLDTICLIYQRRCPETIHVVADNWGNPVMLLLLPHIFHVFFCFNQSKLIKKKFLNFCLFLCAPLAFVSHFYFFG